MNNKRFTLKAYDGLHCNIYDGGVDIAEVHRDDAKGLCFLLNDLHNENQQLRKALWEAEESYIYERYEWSFEIEDAIEDLRKEFQRKYWQDENEI